MPIGPKKGEGESSLIHPRAKGKEAFAPSKSTVYVANLDYSLTNSDIHKIFSTIGHIGKVSIVKNKDGEWKRQSSGFAFVQFTNIQDAHKAVQTFDSKTLNGRTLKVSVARDNGRASEFIRRREYPDKSRCFECGVFGHLSYECPNNQLGNRERPPSKPKRKRLRGNQSSSVTFGKPGSSNPDEVTGGDDEIDDEEFDQGWASAIFPRAEMHAESSSEKKRGLRGPKQSKGYFSDESGSD